MTQAQLAEMRATQDAVDLEAIARFEADLRHDVMAAIHAWGEQAPSARPIIHLGATSCFVTDNGDPRTRRGVSIAAAMSVPPGNSVDISTSSCGFFYENASGVIYLKQ